MIECMCPEYVIKPEVRLNPTTLRRIVMCTGHAELHDQGVGFQVREWHVEESR